MSYLLPLFKAVGITFAIAAIFNGGQALFYPIDFSHSFGLSVSAPPSQKPKSDVSSRSIEGNASPTASYISLMGIRQLATGVTLLIFGMQNKWNEVATVLSLTGIVVAGTDAYLLACAGKKGKAMYHALPGALIAVLAGCVVSVGG